MTATAGQASAQHQLDALMGRVYRRFVSGEAMRETLGFLCQELSRLFGFPLVALLARRAGGALTLEGASEGSLRAELERTPERWDDGATGNGPAGRCVRSGAPQVMSVSDQDFAPWGDAAVREMISAVIAWPVAHGTDMHLLEIFSAESAKSGAVRELAIASEIGRALADVLPDLAHLERQRLLAQALESAGNAAFVTDLDGTIQWCNRAFSALSGYGPDEIVGKNPRMLKSGQQGLRYYRELWATIRAGKVWSGETVDRDHDGATYTIRQTVSPVSVAGRVTHYLSIHDDVTHQRAARERLERAVRTDQATGLLTPATFRAEVGEAVEQGRAFTLAILSIQDFGETAATLGPDAADYIAITLGMRLRRALDAQDRGAALKPGEYVLFLHADVASEAGQPLLARVREAVHKPVPLLGDQLRLQHRITFARYPEHGRSYDELLHHADRLLADEPFEQARRATAESEPSKHSRH